MSSTAPGDVPPAQPGLAFTRSETVFAIAWVVGAIVPVGLPLRVRLGLSLVGLAVLSAQVVYIAALLVPPEPRGVVRHRELAGGVDSRAPHGSE